MTDEQDIKPLVHSLEGTGTPNGQTGIMDLANGCARRWYLNKTQGSMELFDYNLAVGKVLHAYMELYYTTESDEWQASSVQFSNCPPASEMDMARKTAELIFRQYRLAFPPGELGKVVGVEKLLPEEGNAEQRKAVDEAVGYENYTARPDLVVRLTKKDIARVNQTRNLSLTRPGCYMLDWKTTKFVTKMTYNSYRDHPQFAFYMLAWNACFPRNPILGTIVCLMTKTKQPKFHHIYIPFRKAHATALVRSITGKAKKILEVFGPPYPCNQKCCYDWNRECEWLDSSYCKRF